MNSSVKFGVIYLFEMVFVHDVSPFVPSQTKIEMCTRIHTIKHQRSNLGTVEEVRLEMPPIMLVKVGDVLQFE